ncbi:hypothetical protein TrRE_jg11925, partial [Triparma retinervis]
YNLSRATTRGSGTSGEDVTPSSLAIKGVLPSASFPGVSVDVIEVRGEVILPKAAFEELCGNYSNARNAASGILRRYKDGVDANAGALEFVAYDGGEVEVAQLKSAGFEQPEPREIFRVEDGDVEGLMGYYDKVKGGRDGMRFEIDGCVYKLSGAAARSSLGSTQRAPRWAIAHKFAALSNTTSLTGVTYKVGRTGAITPVIEFDEVDIGGVNVKRATGNNWGMLRDTLGDEPKIGDLLVVERAGDVIPKVLRSEMGGEGGRVEVREPDKCPSCGAGVEQLVEEFGVKGIADVIDMEGKGLEELEGYEAYHLTG